jgi:hypothetical protein
MNVRSPVLVLTLGLILVTWFPGNAHALQDREHLTPQEVDHVKDAQVLDKRIEVFLKAAERRLLALKLGETPNAKQAKKDSESWGELPTGTRAQLVGDIARILDEAITNIDDVSARDEKNPLLPKALRKLAAGASRIVEELKPLAAQAQGDEMNSFDQLTENAETIVQAASKLAPPSEEKKGKNKTEKTKDSN